MFDLTEFQDVNVIVILGFGFLGTFLVRYGFSASGFNLLVAVMATQWAIVLNGVELIYYTGTARLNLKRWVKAVTDGVISLFSARLLLFMCSHSLVVAEMQAASALISIGPVLGKTNPVHLILIALMEVSGFVLNGWLLQTLLEVKLHAKKYNHTSLHFTTYFSRMIG